MTIRQTTLFRLVIITIVAILCVLGTTLWLMPKVHALRVAIDNNRASLQVIRLQQSNLTKLSQEIESIRAKQNALDQEVWSFLKEDDFFTAIEKVAQNAQMKIEPLAIADATPTGKILSRSMTASLHGSASNVLTAINLLQQQKPLIAIQRLTMSGGSQAGQVSIILAGQTLWQ